MAHTRVKICGITSVADAKTVAACGADAIGLVFYPPSSRCVDAATAAQIAEAVGPFVTLVGLFVEPYAQTVASVLSQVPLQLLQFHGEETPDFCGQFQRPYVKALRVGAGSSMPTADAVAEHARAFGDAAGILLDSHSEKVAGGSGACFDWDCVPGQGRWIVAGGLNPANVARAVRRLRPYAVDVSTGVESAPGKKDAAKVQTFIDNVRAADASRV